MDKGNSEKFCYVPPTIQRMAPFFAGSPAKVPGFIDDDMQPGPSESSFASLTVPDWEMSFDEKARGVRHG